MGGRDYDGQKKHRSSGVRWMVVVVCTPAGNRAVASALPSKVTEGVSKDCQKGNNLFRLSRASWAGMRFMILSSPHTTIS